MTEIAAPRLPRWAASVMLAVALLLGWLVVRNAVQSLFAQDQPALAAMAWPADGVSLANEALTRAVAAGGTVDATSTALADSALGKAPRAAAPLVVAGLAASEAGDLPRAQSLMEAARARQPRTDIARFWLLDHYLRTGQYAAGLNEVAPAIALRPGSATPLMDVIGSLAAMPAAHRALVDKLATRPVWRAAFFQQEAGTFTSQGAILALLESLPRNPDADAARAEQRAVIGAMFARRDYAAAYGAWLSFLSSTMQPSPGTIYDPNFAGLPGAEPFNWSFQSGPDLTVARTALPDVSEATGLSVNFRASVPGPIASETVPAPGGAYTFSLKARRVGEATTGSRIVATIRCVADNAVLATMPLDDLPAAMRVYRTDLTVPGTCGMVMVMLAGEPGDSFSVVAAQITAVRLTRR